MNKYSSIILTILAAFCGILAVNLEWNENFLILIGALIFLITLLVFEHYETKSGEGTDYSLYDKLRSLFLDKLKNPIRNQFEKEFENLLLIGVSDEPVRQKLEEISSYYREIDTINPDLFLIPENLKEIDAVKTREILRKKLQACDGVLFIRSTSFDSYEWIIKDIDDWGSKNSSLAVLRIDLLVEGNSNSANNNKKALHFQLVPKKTEPGLLPWHLFSRINNRSKSWRSQASFNRMTTLAFISIAPLIVSYLTINNKNLEAKIETQTNLHTNLRDSTNQRFLDLSNAIDNFTISHYNQLLESERDNLRKSFIEIGEMEMSAWELQESVCQQIGWTHGNQGKAFVFPIDSSLVGTSSKNPNELYFWTEEKDSIFINITNPNKTETNTLFQIQQHNFKSMICYSWKEFNDTRVLSICVDIRQGNQNVLISKGFQEDIMNFFNEFYNGLSKEKSTLKKITTGNRR